MSHSYTYSCDCESSQPFPDCKMSQYLRMYIHAYIRTDYYPRSTYMLCTFKVKVAHIVVPDRISVPVYAKEPSGEILL